jgi:Leucine-rich repeat (LRR) protein
MSILSTQFSGTIPSKNMVHLTTLYLAMNQKLNGTIPPSLGNLVKLSELDLSSNQLSGTVPSTIANLTQLNYMLLQNNTQLGGTIPSSLCSVTNLLVFSIDCDNIACSCCTSSNLDNYTNCTVA